MLWGGLHGSGQALTNFALRLESGRAPARNPSGNSSSIPVGLHPFGAGATHTHIPAPVLCKRVRGGTSLLSSSMSSWCVWACIRNCFHGATVFLFFAQKEAPTQSPNQIIVCIIFFGFQIHHTTARQTPFTPERKSVANAATYAFPTILNVTRFPFFIVCAFALRFVLPL